MKIEILKKDSTKSFNYLTGINRAISPAQVTKLAYSILTMLCIRPIVIAEISFITGKLTKYIIDGQHLFNALLRNNMDIPYVTIKVTDQQDLIKKIALLNHSSKSWTLLNYIEAWGSINPNYKKLQQLYNIYDFELSMIASLSMDLGIITGTPTITKHIKNGTFVIINEEQTVAILNYLTDVLKVIPRMNREQNKYVCKEFINFYKSNITTYNHSKFIINLTKNKSKFILATQEENKLSLIFKQLI